VRWALSSEGLVLVPQATNRDLLIALILLGMLFFIHALALFVFAYAAVVAAYYFMKWMFKTRTSRWVTSTPSKVLESVRTKPTYDISKHVHPGGRSQWIKERIPQRWILWVIYLLMIGGAFILGLIFVPIDPAKTTPFLFSNNTVFGRAWNLLVDYGIRLGLMSVFLPIGMIGALHEDMNREKKLIHFMLVPPVLFVLPLSLYTSVLFLPVFGYYSIVGFDFVRNSIQDRWIGFLSVGFVAIFVVVYMQFAAILPGWTIGLVVAIVVLTILVVAFAVRMWTMYRTVVGKHLRSWRSLVGQGPKNFLDWQGIRILFISVIIISLITTEGILLQGDFKYVTSDERQIYQYLEEHSASGIVFVPTTVIGRRVEAFGFKALLAFNSDSALYNGWINASDVKENSHFSLSNFIQSGRFFHYSGPEVERILWNQLFTLNLTSATDRDYALSLDLEYVIVEKNSTGYSDIFHSIYGEYYSELLHTAPLACDLVVDGERLSLFRVPT
jgi:hypothetical protein